MEKEFKYNWENLATDYNLSSRSYGNGKIFYFPPSWSNGWIVEMNPAPGLYVSSAWFTPSKKITYKVESKEDFMWIFCIDSGSIGITKQGKELREIEANTQILVNDKKPYTIVFNKDEHYCFTSVLIYDEFILNLLKGREVKPKIQIEDAKKWDSEHLSTQNIMLIMEQIRWGIRNGDLSLLAYEGMVINLLTTIERNYPEIAKRRKNRRNYVTWENEQKIYKVKKEIDKDILNVPEMDDLIKIAEMSDSKLREGFKNIYGTPIYTYIKIEKMKKAMQLLAADHLSIADIGKMCGYKSPSKFSAAFKSVHEITPSEFRKIFNL